MTKKKKKEIQNFLPSLQKSLSDVKNKYYDHDKKNYKLLTNLLRQRKPLALHVSIRGPDGKRKMKLKINR